MNLFHIAYILLGSGIFLMLFPVLWTIGTRSQKGREAFAQRLGYDLPNRDTAFIKHPRIWIHAVSVGEVQAAETIIHALDAMGMVAAVLLTTTTRTGQNYARQRLAKRASIRYAPLDIWNIVGRFLGSYRPDLLICMETEIWPNWLIRAHRAGIKTAIVNGRISARSIQHYEKIRPLLKPVLETVSCFSMITRTDAERICRLGAPKRLIFVNGNVKFDALNMRSPDDTVHILERMLALDERSLVWVGGSVRGDEFDLLMDVYQRLSRHVPELVFIIAPRHIEKAPRIADIARKKGVQWQYRTDLGPGKERRHAPVIILDTIGELRHIYALASVVFCGGSLVPLGGQNVLEAAIQAKPVLFGPHMEDFTEEKKLLETFGGGLCVKDAKALEEKALDLLIHPEKAVRTGRLARKAVLSQRGAASRHARIIRNLLAHGRWST